jgi:hypothetical protein
VRIGQPFSLLLTCAIAEVEGQRVVVDQGKLSPEAIPLSPFEVVDGGNLVESAADGRRFFQRDYRIRVVTDSAFGQDVPIPALVVTYRLETESASGARNQGIERRHELPALPMRVLALVPADARDIREAPIATFAELDEAAFRASLAETSGLVLLGIGAVGLVVALVSAARVRRPAASGAAVLADHDVVRQVVRDLQTIRQERERDSWTPALVGRVLAVVRVIASYLERREPSQRRVEGGETVTEGTLVHVDRGGARTVISAAITSAALRDDHAPVEHRAAIRDALASLTRAHYGTDQRVDTAALDAALDAAAEAADTLKRQRTWLARTRAATAARLRGRLPSRLLWFR